MQKWEGFVILRVLIRCLQIHMSIWPQTKASLLKLIRVPSKALCVVFFFLVFKSFRRWTLFEVYSTGVAKMLMLQ